VTSLPAAGALRAARDNEPGHGLPLSADGAQATSPLTCGRRLLLLPSAEASRTLWAGPGGLIVYEDVFQLLTGESGAFVFREYR
jgi:hypothetical protein